MSVVACRHGKSLHKGVHSVVIQKALWERTQAFGMLAGCLFEIAIEIGFPPSFGPARARMRYPHGSQKGAPDLAASLKTMACRLSGASAGGGGRGDPAARDPDRRAKDRLEGLD